MKLHLSRAAGVNFITAYGQGYVEVNNRRFAASLLILPERVVPEWPVAAFDSLTGTHLDDLIAHRPEMVLLGTGQRQRFPHPRLLAGLAGAGIGLEAMDTQSACRTFNILVAEGRQVAAALIIEA
jgi:uncharacterized protein